MKDTKILTVTGPSGCGKTSFVNHLQKFFGSEVDVLVSATTRSQRPHELEGRDYYFLSREEFEKRDFLEKVDFHDNLYGLEISEIEKKLNGNSKLLLVIVEKKGAYEVRRAYSGRVLNLLIGISPERSRKRLVGVTARRKLFRGWKQIKSLDWILWTIFPMMRDFSGIFILRM